MLLALLLVSKIFSVSVYEGEWGVQMVRLASPIQQRQAITSITGEERQRLITDNTMAQRSLSFGNYLYEYAPRIFGNPAVCIVILLLGGWKYIRVKRLLFTEIEKRNQLYALLSDCFFEYHHDKKCLNIKNTLETETPDIMKHYEFGASEWKGQAGEKFIQTITSGRDGSFEIRDFCMDGKEHWIQVIQKNLYDDQGRLSCTIGTVRFIDQEKSEFNELVNQAQRDGLTGLYNAHTFRVMTEKMLTSGREEMSGAFLLMDIDYFKRINDFYGHMHGDKAICWLASVLEEWFGPYGLLGRYGGDEFMVLLPNIAGRDELEKYCDGFCRSVRECSEAVEGKVTISAGAVLFRGFDDYDTLFQTADRALYQAKAAGRNRYVVLELEDQAKKEPGTQREHCDVAAKWLDDTAYQAILKETHMIAFEFDLVNKVQHVSPFIGEFLAGDYNGRLLSEVMVSDQVVHPEDLDKSLKFREKIGSGQDGEMVLRLKTPQGEFRWFRMAVTCLEQSGDKRVMAGVLEDIDTRMQYQEVLRHRAEIDTISGIHNKETFFEKTQERLDEMERPYFLLWFDIERFKLINSLFGSEEGNRVLKRIGDILRELALEGETYGRMGNDVFCMCVGRSRGDTVSLVNSITQKLRAYPLDFRFFLPTGIIEIEPGCRESLDVLCDRAAVAQKEIKGDYLRNYAFYKPFMGQKLNRQHELISNMEKALAEHQFQAYFQPQYDMRDGRIIGVETLARWNHPTMGMISPDEFIPMFERNGFIVELDKYIWEIACQAMRGWTDRGLPPVPVSVNVSRIHLYDAKLCDNIIGLCDRYEIPHSLLNLEITESAYTEQPQELFPIMEMLQQAGFIFAMDDFGSGYSSLNILKDIPVDIVKFDLRFLEKARKGEQVGQSILKNTIQLMNELKLSVLAEGVETEKQVSFLKEMNCFYAQGYYYARPMPLKEFEILLKEQEKEKRSEEED